MIDRVLSTTSAKESPIFTKPNPAKRIRGLELFGGASAELTATLELSSPDSILTYHPEQSAPL